MLNTLTTQMKSALNAMNRAFSSAYAGGFAQFIQDLLDQVSAGNVGIASNAYDVDSLCLGGGSFSQDADTTTGLTFGYFGGSFYNGQAYVSTIAGTIGLSASATNYIEVDTAGVAHKSTGGFTAGRLPLYTIVTGGSAITSIAMSKVLLTLLGPGSVTGTMLSAAAASKTMQKGLGTFTATGTVLMYAPCLGNLSSMSIACPTAVTQSDSNYWTASAINLGQAGSGSQALLAATNTNTTKSTGGRALVANVPLALSLGATLTVADGDLIAITFTATGSPAALTGSEVRAKFSFTS